ncbi:MAG: hypothetical protein MJ164_02570 [Alphaproteobacteria bacterium]|nr:hypothetical protein [Alphaproteobacteria bacterium]
MRKSLFFALFMAVMSVGGAFAEIAPDSASYPTYATGQTPSVKDSKIIVATTKFVNGKAGTAETDVNTLAGKASSANSTVTSNGTSITNLGSRIAKPTGTGNVCPSTCGTNGTSKCKCGYISASGPSGTRKWVVIK